MRNITGLSQREIFELYDDEWIELQGTNSKLVIIREEAEKRNLAVNQHRRKQMPPVPNPPFALFDGTGNLFPVSVASLDSSCFQCFLTCIANGAQGNVGSVFQMLNPEQRVGMLQCFTITFQSVASGDSANLEFEIAFADRIDDLQQIAKKTTSANMQAFNAAIGIVCNDIANHYPKTDQYGLQRPRFRTTINPPIFNPPSVTPYAGDGSPIIGLGRPMTNAINKMNDGRNQMPNGNGANKTQPIKPKKRRIDHS